MKAKLEAKRAADVGSANRSMDSGGAEPPTELMTEPAGAEAAQPPPSGLDEKKAMIAKKKAVCCTCSAFLLCSVL